MILLRTLLTEGSNVDRAFKGPSRAGSALLTVVDNYRVYKGNNIYTSKSSLPLYTLVGNRLFKGSATSGSPLANLSGTKVFKSNNVYGVPLATIVDEVAFGGANLRGLPLVTVPGGNPLALMAAVYYVLYG